MYTVLSIEDPGFTDDRWQAYFDCLITLHERHDSLITSRTWQELKQHLLAASGNLDKFEEYVAFAGERACAWVSVRVLTAADGTPSGHGNFDVLEDVDFDALATVTAAVLAGALDRLCCDRVQMAAHDTRLTRLADAWDGLRLNRIDRYRLRRRDANIAQIDAWLSTYPGKCPDLRMVFFQTVPEEYVADYVELFRQFIADMPKERDDAVPFTLEPSHVRELERVRAEVGSHLYTFALVNEEGRMIAHTNGSINERNPVDMYQAMTGVHRDYRGRGLSRWLKAALFRRTGTDFPGNETITTDMRAANEPIQKVNADMGFRLMSRGYEFSLERARLRRIAGTARGR